MNKIIQLLVISMIFAGWCASCLSKKETDTAFNVSFLDYPAQNMAEEIPELPEEIAVEITRAERIMRSYAEAYPRQIDKVEFRNDDWAVLLRGTWFYFADGRMLPEDKLENAENYSRGSFYYYPEELPPWQAPSPEQIARFRAWESSRRENPPRRANYFLDTLWRIHSREEAMQRIQTFRFLGNTIYLHYMVLENMSLVEQYILAAGRADPQVQAWINNIRRIEHFSWRNITNTQSRSYHSYGLAIDIIPRSYGGREAYWLWTSNSGVEWWTVPYNRRWHPPDAVIKAFEKFGFIWGGKWQQYDTIHFEYRPEILIFNGMPPETRR